MTWQAGESGNPGGRPKSKEWTEAIRRAVHTIPEDDPHRRKRLELLAEALVLKAQSGDVSALQEVGNRLEGKVPQALIGDSDEDPINVVTRIERIVVRPQSDN